MNIRNCLIGFAIGLIFLFLGFFAYTLTTFWEDFTLYLLRINIDILGLIFIIILMILLLPDMKYSYKTKNALGILVITGILLQIIFFPLRIKIAVLMGTSLVSLSLFLGLIGVIIALIDA
ncbi:MAG: hypothetical protein ACTSYC_07035 [Promethearchaeota archaeon]